MPKPKTYKYAKMCLGIDQSYTRSGIAIAGLTNEGEIDIIHCESVPGLTGTGNHSAYRKLMKGRIYRFMRRYRALGDECYALCESVRVHTEGAVSIKNHLAWGALQGGMADFLMEQYDITLRVVDTRAWKKAVVGTSKSAVEAPKRVDPKKWPTIQCIMHEYDVPKELLTLRLSDRSRTFTWQDKAGNKYTYDDNVADACSIAIYGLIRPLTKLKLAP